MLTAIVLILVLIAVLAVAGWWFFEFDAPEVVIPAAAPGLGAGVLYWYGGPLAWAIAGYCIYRFFSTRQRADKSAK
jgi:hypothetical protein